MPARFNFDRVADVYEETRLLPPLVLDGLAEQMADLFDRGTVLDAGVGTGRFAAALRDRGFSLVGVDISRRMMVRARERALPNLAVADVARLPLRSASVDNALLIGLFHLLPDWREAVLEVARVVRRFVVAIDGGAKGTPVGGRYWQSVREAGVAEPTPVGIPIPVLVERVLPVRRFPRITWEQEATESDVIDLFEKKAFTTQWALPDEVHRDAIARLRAEDAGRRFRTERTWELVAWRSEDLRGI